MSFKAGLKAAGVIPSTYTPTAAPENADIYIPTGDGTRDRTYAEGALQDECNLIATTPPDSGRNGALNTAAFNMARFINADIITKAEVHAALTTAALMSGLPEPEIRQCLQGDRHQQKSAEKLGGRPAVPESTLEPIAPAHTIDPTDFPAAAAETPDDANTSEQAEPSNSGRHAPDLTEAEQNFWQTRPYLTNIYNAALRSTASPWAALGVAAARAISTIPIGIGLPPIIGVKPGSVNMYCAIVGPPGAGKGLATGVGNAFVHTDAPEKPIGSPEGLLDAYGTHPTAVPREPGLSDDEYNNRVADAEAIYTPSIILDIAEVGDLAAQSQRGGALLPLLCKGFSGERIGFTYRKKGAGDISVPAHEYRLTAIVGVQPERCDIIMGDVGRGTPQRFMWFPAQDRRVPDEDDGTITITPLTLPTAADWRATIREHTYIPVDTSVRRELRAARVSDARGQVETLNGHAPFCREKFALALAVLDCRMAVTSEDWRLAGIAADVSVITRDWMTAQAWQAQRGEAFEKGRLRGVESVAADDQRAHETEATVRRIVMRMLAKLDKGPLSNRDFDRGLGRDHRWKESVKLALVANALAKQDDQGLWCRLPAGQQRV